MLSNLPTKQMNSKQAIQCFRPCVRSGVYIFDQNGLSLLVGQSISLFHLIDKLVDQIANFLYFLWAKVSNSGKETVLLIGPFFCRC